MLLATSSLAQSRGYPARTITLVVPWPAGGIVDSGARLAARRLSEDLKQPVIVENKPGAAGTIGAGFVARSNPDGYTLLVGGMANMVVNPLVYKDSLTYGPETDFKPIYGLLAMPVVIVTKAGSPYKNLVAMLDAAKAKPSTLTYASSGTGTVSHLSSEILQGLTGTSLMHVPYKGSTPAVTDLLGGVVDLAFDYALTTAPHIRSGKLTPLAVSGPSRLVMLPTIPTLGELGYPGGQISSWLALYAPAATPQPIVDKLASAMSRVMKDGKVVEGIEYLGAQAMPMDAASLVKLVETETAALKPVIDRAGVTPN